MTTKSFAGRKQTPTQSQKPGVLAFSPGVRFTFPSQPVITPILINLINVILTSANLAVSRLWWWEERFCCLFVMFGDDERSDAGYWNKWQWSDSLHNHTCIVSYSMTPSRVLRKSDCWALYNARQYRNLCMCIYILCPFLVLEIGLC